MESKIVLNAKTKDVIVTRTPNGTSQLDVVSNGTLTIVGGIQAYIDSVLEKHNLNSHAHPNLWYVHIQSTESNTWNITHNLNRHPSVTIVDDEDNIIVGCVRYVDLNNVIVEFNQELTGKAYLN